jgi:hypothetical protein
MASGDSTTANLPVAGALATTDVLPIDQGTTKKVALNTLGDWFTKTYASFLPSGSAPTYGWATRTVQAKASDIICIKDVKCSDGLPVALDGVHDDSSGLLAAINYMGARASQGGTIFQPAGTLRQNTAITVASTHGIRLLGEAPAYAAGHDDAPSRIDFYGAGNQFTLSGLVATQSAFTLENIRCENKGNPNTGSCIIGSAAGYTAGLEVVNSSITKFAYGVQTVTGSSFGYQHFKNSAIFSNATWGVAAEGDDISFENCYITNNGPRGGGNTFQAAPAAGNVYIAGVSTNVCFDGATVIASARVGIYVNNAYGVKINGTYFEDFDQCSIQCSNVYGLDIAANYHNPNTEAPTILLANCSAVSVRNSGYAPNVYVIGLTEYQLSGCNVFRIGTTYDRTVNNAQMAFRDVYGSRNIDINDQDVAYVAAPTGVALTNITGPTLQAEIGPFGAAINRYVATAGGYFVTSAVTATAGQYVYFSVLIRNATLLQAIVRDTAEANPIVVDTSFTSYSKEWSIVTAGGLAPAGTHNYRLTLVIVGAETFDLGGIVSYLGATPLYKQIFSFANHRRTINQNQSPTTIAAATYTVLTSDSGVINNNAGTLTLTLLAAATYPGKQLVVRTIQAQTVVSAASNVVPLAGGAAGTAILAATAGKWAMLQSDGANWQIMMSN